MNPVRVLATLAATSWVLCGNGWSQTTTRASVDSSGTQTIGGYASQPSISGDGRFVAFTSIATNLVPGDTNAFADIFVRDRQSGITTRVSVDSVGTQATGDSTTAVLSEDGRYVAFMSNAADLVAGDTNGFGDLFVHDRQTGATVRVNVDSGGAQADDFTGYPSISADGSRVAFWSQATNLVPGDTNGLQDVFVHDLQSGTTVRASVDSSGAQGTLGQCLIPSISGDGNRVAFSSESPLVAGDTNGSWDIFVRDLLAGTTVRASVATGGGQSFAGFPLYCAISSDGRYVAFRSIDASLVPGDTNSAYDVYRHDLQTVTTVRASVSSSGVQGNDRSDTPRISSDGRYMTFWSLATNLVSGDANGDIDVYLRDLQDGVTTRISVDSGGVEGDGSSSEHALSADGSSVAFSSDSSNLVAGDTNGAYDVFVRVRGDAWSLTRFCFPGENGVVACPCGNPPSSSGRGCNNFGSGPADSGRLTATGQSSLAGDTIVLTADGLNNTSFTVFWQGRDPAIAAGVAHGAGVRCVGAMLRRLYNAGNAVGATIARPGMGDLPVHLRSAAVGDTILAGQSRHYFAIYRDPAAAVPCGNTATTINVTNAGSIVWSP